MLWRVQCIRIRSVVIRSPRRRGRERGYVLVCSGGRGTRRRTCQRVTQIIIRWIGRCSRRRCCGCEATTQTKEYGGQCVIEASTIHTTTRASCSDSILPSLVLLGE